jgi:hypothetical protein
VLSHTLQLGGNVYYRTNDIKTLNGDANDDYEDCFETSPTPLVDCTELSVNNRTRTEEDGYGAALQLTHLTERNQLSVGVSADRGTAGSITCLFEGLWRPVKYEELYLQGYESRQKSIRR